jgi:Ca2+-dependent lipid-binding protein
MALPLSSCTPGKQILQLELWSENSVLNDEFIGAVEIDLQKMYGKQSSSTCRQQQHLQLDTGGTITCSLTFGDTIEHFKAEKERDKDEAPARLIRRESTPSKDQKIIIVQVHRGPCALSEKSTVESNLPLVFVQELS